MQTRNLNLIDEHFTFQIWSKIGPKVYSLRTKLISASGARWHENLIVSAKFITKLTVKLVCMVGYVFSIG